MNFRKSAVFGVAVLAVAVCSFAFAQDDLDDLLNALEGEAKSETPVAVHPKASEVPAAETPMPIAEVETPAELPESNPVEPVPVVAEEKLAPAPSEPAPAKPSVLTAIAATLEPEVVETVATAESTAVPVNPASTVAAKPDDNLVESIVTTERLRREAFDVQAKREIDAARACLRNKEYEECAEHYTQANKLLNDRPAMKKYRRECLQGIAESYYRAARQEWTYGSKQKAIEQMEKAKDMRHPKARRELEDMVAEEKTAEVRDFADIAHIRNEQAFQAKREKNRKSLRRARQLLSVGDVDGALESCEKVLVKGNDPYNEEALRLRKAILKKQAAILKNEQQVSRDGMIADVGKAWRPVYAPNASEIEAVSASTRKTKVSADDPERAVEQSIVKRMKEIRLPQISFKPPATIIDAVEYFRSASKDLDRPDIPLEQRGFNFVLKLPKALQVQAAETDSGDSGFGAENADESAKATAGVPVIPMITASDISFYEALKLVCDSVGYKFKIQGSIVMVMDKDMTIDEMVTRSYPVLAMFMDRMGSAASDMKEMRSAGFGSSSSAKKEEEEDSQEKDWKAFFEEMGVKWPEGSSIMYIKAIGKLRVKNTYENLAEFEKALADLNVNQTLIEIEARFVEVEQEDLNSLGFEWILNDNYAIGGGWITQALGLTKNGGWTEGWTTSASEATTITTDGGATFQSATASKRTGTGEKIWSQTDINGNALSQGIAGINAFGGTSDYGNGTRYLSTEGNHISGEGKSTNDQFLRVNAFLGNADLSMILHMLSQRSDTDLLNAPKVLTKPGENAVIKVVTEFIYPTDFNVNLQSSQSSGSSYGGSQSAVLAVVEPESFTMREVGVILDVTPQLTDDGNIIDLKLSTQVVDEPTWKNYGMKIPFSGNSSIQSFEGIGDIFTSLADVISAVGGTMSSDTREFIIDSATMSAMNAMNSLSSTESKNITYYEAPMEQPFFHVRSIDSSVAVYPGSTIVMGGLIREQRKAMDDKIPFLGDLPFVGRFFRSHAEQTNKRNLLIFLTARKVDARGREMVEVGDSSSEADVKASPEKKE